MHLRPAGRCGMGGGRGASNPPAHKIEATPSVDERYLLRFRICGTVASTHWPSGVTPKTAECVESAPLTAITLRTSDPGPPETGATLYLMYSSQDKLQLKVVFQTTDLIVLTTATPRVIAQSS